MDITHKLKNFGKAISPNNYKLISNDRLEFINMANDPDRRGGVSRPSLPMPYLSTDTGAKVPIIPIPPIRLFDVAENVPDLRTVIDTLPREMFKNEYKIEPKYKYKCLVCLTEYKNKPIDQKKITKSMNDVLLGKKENISTDILEKIHCINCENEDVKKFVQHNPLNIDVVKTLLKNPVNGNYQSFDSLAKQLERDLLVTDNAYLGVLKTYQYRPPKKEDEMLPNGEPIVGVKQVVDETKTEVAELIRIHPAQFAFIADSDGRIGFDDNSERVFVCPNFEHRTNRLNQSVCPECGTKALKAICEVNSVFSIGIVQPKRVIYGEGEVIWGIRTRQDLLYGYSTLISIWKKALALYYMDEYIYKYFDKQRPPRQMVVVNSRSYEAFKKSWQEGKEGAREDPTMPRPIITDNKDGNAKNSVHVIDLVGSLKDLEFKDIRAELRQAIFAAYGLPPFMFGEVAKGGFGGANMQVTETNRTVTSEQVILKNTFFTPILEKILGITDTVLELNSGEETDDLREVQLKGEKIQNAVTLFRDAGFNIYMDENGDFIHSQIPNPVIQAQIMGGGNDQEDNSMRKKSGDKSKNRKQNSEEDTKFQGEVHNKRPSDLGGSGQGSSSSGYSLNNKSVSEIIQYGIGRGWTQAHIVNEVHKHVPAKTLLEIKKYIRDGMSYGFNE